MIKFDKFELNNGLKVIVHHDKSTPIVAMNIIYKVGSRDESVRRTGFAHLFEHLMFSGSINNPRYGIPLEEAGGENNAFTNSDYTNYYLTLPKNNLEIAFWMESDRMLNLVLSEEKLNIQRNVVIEEFKQNYLNQPFGDAFMLLKPLAYKKHPYRWNTIGKNISHIENATIAQVKSFYKKYYNPNNAILSIAGNIKTAEVKRLAEKWFGPIPSGKAIEHFYPKESRQLSIRKQSVKRDIPQRAIYMAWHMPKRTDSGFYHCDLISDILSNGDSSRLYRKLVKDNSLFSQISAFVTGDLDNGLFVITGRLFKNTSMTKAIKAIHDELDLISNKLVDNEEFRKVKNKAVADQKFSRISVLSKAMSLGYFELLGDADLWNNEINIYQKISRNEIRAAARKIFQSTNQSILTYNKL